MPDHCPHFTTGFCTVCQALDQALAELQRVRGQRDRLAECVRNLNATVVRDYKTSIVGDWHEGCQCQGCKLVRECIVMIEETDAAMADIATHP
jgi:hypothetical protein